MTNDIEALRTTLIRLLACPDLNLDTLEFETTAAIRAAHFILADRLPDVGTTDDARAERQKVVTPPLPPDPEQMNGWRSAWAGKAVRAFQKATGTDDEDALCDLLADLMHWADRKNYEFEAALLRARDHYHAETLEDG